MQFLLYAYVIPLGAFIMVLCLLALQSMKPKPENEIEVNADPRLRELELLDRMYSMEIEHARPWQNSSRPGSH